MAAATLITWANSFGDRRRAAKASSGTSIVTVAILLLLFLGNLEQSSRHQMDQRLASFTDGSSGIPGGCSRRFVTSQKHQAWGPPSRSARNRSAETKHRRPDPAFKPPAPPSGSGGGAAGALLAAASSAFWRIRSASRRTLPRPRTRSWRYSQKLTPNRRHVFFKLAKVSRARRPDSLRVLPLIFRFLT